MTAALRDAAARALLARQGPPVPGSLAHLAGADDPSGRAQAAASERARQRASSLLPDLEVELVGQVRRTPHGVSDTAARRFIEWACEHSTDDDAQLRASIGAAAALHPTCEVEWSLAFAVAGTECADGFDLDAHIKAVAAVVRRVRRLA